MDLSFPKRRTAPQNTAVAVTKSICPFTLTGTVMSCSPPCMRKEPCTTSCDSPPGANRPCTWSGEKTASGKRLDSKTLSCINRSRALSLVSPLFTSTAICPLARPDAGSKRMIPFLTLKLPCMV